MAPIRINFFIYNENLNSIDYFYTPYDSRLLERIQSIEDATISVNSRMHREITVLIKQTHLPTIGILFD